MTTRCWLRLAAGHCCCCCCCCCLHLVAGHWLLALLSTGVAIFSVVELLRDLAADLLDPAADQLCQLDQAANPAKTRWQAADQLEGAASCWNTH